MFDVGPVTVLSRSGIVATKHIKDYGWSWGDDYRDEPTLIIFYKKEIDVPGWFLQKGFLFNDPCEEEPLFILDELIPNDWEYNELWYAMEENNPYGAIAIRLSVLNEKYTDALRKIYKGTPHSIEGMIESL